MESQTKKIVQPRYRFYNELYKYIDEVSERRMLHWSAKERPKLVYCIIDEAEKNEHIIITDDSYVEIFDTLEAAQQEADAWNEE